MSLDDEFETGIGFVLQSDDFRQKCIKKSDVIQDVVGSGPHRKIVLSPQTDKQYSSE